MLVTIITACYNAGSTLEASIASLKAQTYPHIEHIVIDGGSKDGTVEIIRKHADGIAYWVSEPDKGLGDAWNKGLKLAKGGIIGLLNADDLYHERAVEEAVAALKAGDWALTYGDAILFETDIRNPTSTFHGGFNPAALYNGMGFLHTTCFVPARIYRELGGFDTRYRIAVDTDFLLRCHGKGVEFRKSGSITYMRNGGMSQKHFTLAYREYLSQLRRHGFSRFKTAKAWLWHLWALVRLRKGAPQPF